MVTSDPLELGVSGLHEARRLRSAAVSLFAEDKRGAMMDFEKPSNPVFQPLEYRSTNCCIHTPVLPKAISPGSGIPQPPGGGFDPDSSYCWPYLPSKPLDPYVEVSPRGSIWYIDNDRNMPTIADYFEASVHDYSGDVSDLKFDWTFEGEFEGIRDSVGAKKQSDQWKPSSWGGKIFGGNVTVTASVEIDEEVYVGASSNTIYGENPTSRQLRREIGSPWFFAQLVREESSCRQFDSSGLPVHSSDNGFGLTQLTNPPPTVAQVWDWQANIDESQSRLSGMETVATDFWTRQVSQWKMYNSQQRTDRMPEVAEPDDRTYDHVTFGYSGSGKRPMSDGIWIQQYNGSPSGHWLVWKNNVPNQAPDWEFNDTGYVGRVVTSQPCP